MVENKAPTKHLKMRLKALKLSVMCMSILQYIKGPPALPLPPPWSGPSKTSFFNRVCVAGIPIHSLCIFIHMLFILFNATFLYSSVLLGFHSIQ
jgi:hypothetical protein